MKGLAQLVNRVSHHQTPCTSSIITTISRRQSWKSMVSPNYRSLHLSSEYSLQCLTQHHMQNIGHWEWSFWVGEPAAFSPDHYVHLSWNRRNKDVWHLTPHLGYCSSHISFYPQYSTGLGLKTLKVWLRYENCKVGVGEMDKMCLFACVFFSCSALSFHSHCNSRINVL